ncbi:MAG: hypothetical protein GTO45_33960 [Candidatus Aminicenantes bacterium]|nr:hypothetical protein [Candidatus Aminicenantes bacterium]NIM83715.1 hypothetical protein [Candidatus Aminicenantes bacterium]NIN23140.1 hypothetical protein [Candidatus Aminicenantes bacterium]NIN46867.1 hypothetical protein [Candidatus Aminicenantes bacterium]NIN89789.1 hypothetical protein [Candidatus Aminicenantes bacterium]
MANYNGGAGLNQQVLNNISKDIYDSVYPTFFKGQVEINNFNIKSVSWDITQAPVFDLNPSQRALAFLKEAVKKEVHDSTLVNQLESFIDESVITFELSVPKFEVTIETGDGDTSPPVDGSIDVYLQADIDADDKLVASIIKGEVNIQGEPTLVWILNHVVLPVVQDQLNKILLKGVPLPALEFGGVKLSTPAAALENETLLVFAALSSQGTTVPPAPGSAWPQDKFFALSDDVLIETVAAKALESTQKSGSASTKIAILKLEAKYSVGVKNPIVELNTGNKLTVGVDAFGSGSVKVKADFGFWKPSVTLGLGITASPKVNGEVSVDSANNVKVKFVSVDDFKVKLDIANVPDWLDKFISEIISFLTKPIAQLIGKLLTGISFTVYKIPEFEIDENGIKVDILVSDIGISTMTDSGNKKLLTVTGDVEVKKD